MRELRASLTSATLVACIGALLCPSRARGDTSVDETPGLHALGIELCLTGRSSRDDLLVPLLFSGGGLGVRPRYVGELGPGALEAEAHLGLSILANRHGQAGATLDWRLGARYPVTFTRAGGWTFAVGPALGWDSDVSYLFSWDNAHGYWTGARWIGVVVHTRGAPLASVRMDVSAELAVAALLSRPPAYRENKQDALKSVGFYVEAPMRDAELATLNELQLARVALDLRDSRELRVAATGWVAGVEARIVRASDPEPSFGLELTLRAGWMWGW